MKKIVFISFVGVFLFTNLVSNAQKDDNGKDRWEKYRAEKVRFLTENLNLTPSEAQKFWPVYNQMEKERWEAQKLRRETENKVRDAEAALSDKEIIKLTREFSGSMKKEGELLVKYNEDLLKVLPPKKVLRLYQAENEFRMHMIKKYRDRGRDKPDDH